MEALSKLVAKPKTSPDGKQDLLLRLFESEWFNEWMCLQYLYQYLHNPQGAGVEDYLCNKLYRMPEAAVERYLLQFLYLAISKPGSTLEKTIVALCSRSFVIAVKAHWLLLALSQDQGPKTKHVDALRERCERAALEGFWDVPIRNPRLDPLSPQSSGMSPDPLSPILSPLTLPPTVLMGGQTMQRAECNGHAPMGMDAGMDRGMPGMLLKIEEGHEPTASPQTSGVLAEAMSSQGGAQQGQPEVSSEFAGGSAEPATPEGPSAAAAQAQGLQRQGSRKAGLQIDLSCIPTPETRGLTLTHTGPGSAGPSSKGGAGQQGGAGSVGAACSGPSSVQLTERISKIRAELGEGEGVSALLHRSAARGETCVVAGGEEDMLLSDDDVAGGISSAPPLSPSTRLRHDTYCATLDFLEALCDASSSLTSFSQEERQKALRHALEAINKQLDKVARRDVAVWWPMKSGPGRRNSVAHERVLRIVSKEAVLLTSRERAPFMLFVEVLWDEDEAEGSAGGAGQAASSSAAAGKQQGQGLAASSDAGSRPVPGCAIEGLSDSAFTTSRGGSEAGLVGRLASPPPGSSSSSEAGDSRVSDSAYASELATLACSGDGAQAQLAGGHEGLGRGPSATSSINSAGQGQAAGEEGLGRGMPGTGSPHLPTGDSPIAAAAFASAVLPQPHHERTTSLPLPSSASSSALAALGLGEGVAPSAGSMSAGPHQHNRPHVLGSAAGAAAGPMVIPHRRRQEGASMSGLPQQPAQQQVHAVAEALGSTVSSGGIASAAAVAAAAAAGAMTPSPEQPQQQVPSRQATGGPKEAGGGGGGLTHVVRSLCFTEPAVAVHSAAEPSSAPSAPATAAAAVGAGPLKQEHPHAGQAHHSAAHHSHPAIPVPAAAPGARLQRPMGAAVANAPVALTEEEVGELIQAGCLSPPPGRDLKAGAAGQHSDIMGKMAGVMASLRGEAPLVRVHLRVLDQGVSGSHAGKGTDGSLLNSSGSGSIWGGLGGSDVGAGGGITSVLSKWGLCRRPVLDEDAEDDDGSGVRDGSGGARGGASAGAGGGASGRLVPAPKLVSLSLEVAGGVNLAITSPYRKSRRTPSHEAISLVASKLKIHEIPPPVDHGPPLGPPPGAAEEVWGSEDEVGRGSGSRPKGVGASGALSIPTSSASFSNFAALQAACQPSESTPEGSSSSQSTAQPGAQAPSQLQPATSLSFPVASRQNQADVESSPQLLLIKAQGRGAQAQGAHAPSAAEVPGPGPGPAADASTAAEQASSAAAAAAAGAAPAASLGRTSDAGTSSTSEASAPMSLAESLRQKLSQLASLVGSTSGSPVQEPAQQGSGSGSNSRQGSGALPAPQQDGDSPLPQKQQQQQQSAQAESGSLLLRRRISSSGGGAASTSSAGGAAPSKGLLPGSSSGRASTSGGEAAAPSMPQSSSVFATAAAAAAALGAGTRPVARVSSSGGGLGSRAGVSSGQAGGILTSTSAPVLDDPAAERRRREACAVYGERWSSKTRRIQKESPHGRRKGWGLRCVIVKSGDDCRQELLACQLVRAFSDIFAEAGLPLWVRAYDVLVTSSRTALIEVVPDALSIHTIKHRSPPGASFSDHFFSKWPRGTPECVAAQRRFTESLAAYSIICYLLQIKDRHNGNVLVDDDGHLVHIDFGFMLSNSPGGVNFESAPFKLTRELLEVMDSNSEGKPSELFDYFKVLVIQGFLVCRKHADRLVLMVRMMSKSGLPCFKGGERCVKALEKRFAAHLTEVACVQHVLSLISDSLDAWRTRQYDYYQRLLNGIL